MEAGAAPDSIGLLGALLTDFERAARLTAAPKQAKARAAMTERFLWAEAIARPEQITAGAIESHLASRAAQVSTKTVANHLSAIRTFCNFLRRRGLLANDPTQGIRLRPPDRQLPRYLEPAEVAEVLRIARERGIWGEVCLALSTGLRLSEMIRLRWDDIDWQRRCLVVRKSKTHRPRQVPLCRSAVVALRLQRRRAGAFDYIFPARQTWRCGWRYKNSARAANWWTRALGPIKAQVLKFNSLPGCSTGRGWHLLRHTFASRAAQAGVSLYKLAAWLGHSDVRTTQRYAHLQEGWDEQIEAASPL